MASLSLPGIGVGGINGRACANDGWQPLIKALQLASLARRCQVRLTFGDDT